MFVDIVLLIFGFIILIKGADIFVDGASSTAMNFKVPPIFIGLTIVAFGTSAPELAVSIQSLIKGSGDIVLGNVIGSNILNILLIIGVSSLFHSLTVKSNTVKKELPITLLLSMLFIVLINDTIFGQGENVFSRQDAIVLLLFFTVFLYYLFTLMKSDKENLGEETIKHSIPKSFLFIALGLAGIVLGSNFVVNGASGIAEKLGVSEKMIALTIVALGTSLPELVTSVTATRKGEYDLAIGNVVGSNIFNICVVLGIPVSILGGIPKVTFNLIDLAVLFVAVLLLFLFSLQDRKINKKEGIIFLLIFVVYYSYVVIGQ
ncbi:MAG: calcium/sodium antiporter [Clostridia bacterium]|nr:calcium/sodium antiporter [Clostridia bacterium]